MRNSSETTTKFEMFHDVYNAIQRVLDEATSKSRIVVSHIRNAKVPSKIILVDK